VATRTASFVAGLLIAALGGCRGEAATRPRLLGAAPGPLVFAHRGGGGEAPESTLAALLGSHRRDPALVVDLDVHASRDGHLVVIHDATVDRTTNGSGRVAALTLAELKALDAGHCATPGRGNGTARRGRCADEGAGPFPFRGQGHRIPTLDEVLAALPVDARLSVEVKAPGFEATVAAALRAAGRLSRLAIGSVDDDVAARLRALLPEAAHFLPRGAATCLALAAKLRAGFWDCPRFEIFAAPRAALGLDLTTPAVIGAAHARGVPVVYWTINDEAEMERLLRAGADGLYTDYPARARRVIERLRAARALP
jgi:glycerophosphoryl diester phosphodiesterase